ncbi:alkene reductase [Rhodococcus sp. T2V]|uniref:alkene reductase n=1 Tax=Rhodococcus sp. T2V TaxID=3034164 RepID=UPI0023E15364|nr:alkene reductase [Rhodococcus sp. T2V]MDF3306437.1 alkene reductase [Rhodococcus sp. T2V]
MLAPDRQTVFPVEARIEEAEPLGDRSADLFDAVNVGRLTLSNRVFMAPMTRSRAPLDGSPTPLMAEYYRQRAGAGLIITEGTQPSAVGQGYPDTPGIYTDAHESGWAAIADAVRGAGGRMFVQLMHAGRLSHPDNSGHQPVAPSSGVPEGQIYTHGGRKVCPPPRVLGKADLPGVIDEFVQAAGRTVSAGVDGVELHGANGYLLHQFLSDGTNRRSDEYGGEPAARAKFVVETVRAVAAHIGADRVGLRVSPGVQAEYAEETDAWGPYEVLLRELADLGLGYLHVLTSDGMDMLRAIRSLWPGTLVVNTGFEEITDVTTARELIRSGIADAVSVGRPFISNPDLVERWRTGEPIAPSDRSTYYGGGALGYTDYPSLAG